MTNESKASIPAATSAGVGTAPRLTAEELAEGRRLLTMLCAANATLNALPPGTPVGDEYATACDVDASVVEWAYTHIEALLAAAERDAQAGERERRLREVLRKHAIRGAGRTGDGDPMHRCDECGKPWLLTQGERHAPGCLAALAETEGR